jgi:hypothetical protein
MRKPEIAAICELLACMDPTRIHIRSINMASQNKSCGNGKNGKQVAFLHGSEMVVSESIRYRIQMKIKQI